MQDLRPEQRELLAEGSGHVGGHGFLRRRGGRRGGRSGPPRRPWRSASASRRRRSDRPETRPAQARSDRRPAFLSDTTRRKETTASPSPRCSSGGRRVGRVGAACAARAPGRRLLHREGRVPSVPVVLLARAGQSARRIRTGEVGVEVAVSLGNVPLPSIEELDDVAHATRRAPAGRLVVDQFGGRLVDRPEALGRPPRRQ